MNHPSTRRRYAFSLVELSISMSAGSALMVLAIGLVHQSMDLATTGRQRSDDQRSLFRLTSEFRRDVHRAVQCTVDSPQSVQLVLPTDDVVTYQADENRVVRRQPVADGQSRHESFDLGADVIATFALIDGQTRAVLILGRKPPGAGGKPRVGRNISAVVGRLILHEQGQVSQ